eukprot:1152584-Pelagomonas_calceolata.AAC.4
MDVPLSWKELTRVTDLGSRELQVLQSKTICAAYVHGGKTCPKKALAGTFEKGSASNIVALGHRRALVRCMCALGASRRLEMCLSLGAGELGHSDVLAWVRAASSRQARWCHGKDCLGG